MGGMIVMLGNAIGGGRLGYRDDFVCMGGHGHLLVK